MSRFHVGVTPIPSGYVARASFYSDTGLLISVARRHRDFASARNCACSSLGAALTVTSLWTERP